MEFITYIMYASIYLGLVATSFYVLTYVAGKKTKPLLFEDNELPKVSVIIPVWNEEKSIERTLKTILASDYPEDKLEIIVVDDGSADKSLEIAMRFKSNRVKVFSKKNGGKGDALNYGIKRCSGEIVFTMDADTVVPPYSLKKMVRYFKNKDVMLVSPAIMVYEPKTFLERVQHIEFLLGLFLRKTFSFLNAIHITPGAFSAIRKEFFEKHGYYNVGNITEDLEITLRVQYHGYKIENAPDAPAYAIARGKFVELMVQRRRWYVGLIRNLLHYRKMISPKYGDMGAFVLPVAILSIFFAIIVTVYLFIKTLFDIKQELLFLNNINFDFNSVLGINGYILERFFFLLFTNPVFVFIMFFMVIFGIYLFYASRRLGKIAGIAINLPLFIMFFAVLFGFWWLVSMVYVLFNKKVVWR
jgi:cellulose synthase/poly-beta-1,6-N-acetylglucosamine synthase-like glycosyltransferase